MVSKGLKRRLAVDIPILSNSAYTRNCCKIVDDFSSKLGLPSIQETVETIDADHRDMARFGSISDSGYRDISGVLKLFIRDRLKATELGTAGIKANPRMWKSIPLARSLIES